MKRYYTLSKCNTETISTNIDLLHTNNFSEILNVFTIVQRAVNNTKYDIQVMAENEQGREYLLEMGDLMNHVARLDLEKKIEELQEELADL